MSHAEHGSRLPPTDSLFDCLSDRRQQMSQCALCTPSPEAQVMWATAVGGQDCVTATGERI